MTGQVRRVSLKDRSAKMFLGARSLRVKIMARLGHRHWGTILVDGIAGKAAATLRPHIGWRHRRARASERDRNGSACNETTDGRRHGSFMR